MDAILLPVNDDRYAVEIGSVREVAAAPTVTPLPTAPSTILGLFNLRGEIVPLLDTAALLGIGAIAPAAFALVLHTAFGLAGLATTAIPQPVSLGEQVGRSELPATAGVYQHQGEAVVLLDLNVLLSADRGPGVAV